MSTSVRSSAERPAVEAVLGRLLPKRQCAHVHARAASLGVEPESVALSWGLIEERAFYRGLAAELDMGFVARPFAIDRPCISVHAAEAGIVRAGAAAWVAAPRGRALRLFLQERPAGCRLTTPAVLSASLRTAFATEEALQASGALPLLAPAETAQRDGHGAGFVVAGWFAAVAALVFFEPLAAAPLTVPIGLLYAWMVGQRIVSIFTRGARDVTAPALSPRDLPPYSVLVALHREESVVPQLVEALAGLDYPPEKLEILFLVEEDDAPTRAAFAACALPPFMRVVVCPPGAPRTKPRALNIGLRECTGDLVAIYDAEDRPEPDQLSKAAALFRTLPDDIACLQAEIAIENGDTNFWTRGFALEYAALFQLVVPGLCRFALPVALGGTSNHFRRDVLLALNGWDAWNVTEDADLGVRLALHGLHVAHLPSRTWEEAPTDFQVWRKQRTRWIKGWMQTSHVHLAKVVAGIHRRPPRDTIGLLHHLVGTPVAALLTPLFTAALVMGWMSDRPNLLASGLVAYGSAIAAAAVLMMVGLFRAARPALSARARLRALIEVPVYLLLVCSCAAIALVELVYAPFRWNKTPHGPPVPEQAGRAPPPRARRKVSRHRVDLRVRQAGGNDRDRDGKGEGVARE